MCQVWRAEGQRKGQMYSSLSSRRATSTPWRPEPHGAMLVLYHLLYHGAAHKTWYASAPPRVTAARRRSRVRVDAPVSGFPTLCPPTLAAPGVAHSIPVLCKRGTHLCVACSVLNWTA